jgi:hypothetical protein
VSTVICDVERVDATSEQCQLVVRQLGSGDWQPELVRGLQHRARRGELGAPIVAVRVCAERPDERDRAGHPRVDLYVVALAEPREAEQFRVGDQVVLFAGPTA